MHKVPHAQARKHKPVRLVKLCRKFLFKLCKGPWGKVCRSPTCELENPNLPDYIPSNHLRSIAARVFVAAGPAGFGGSGCLRVLPWEAIAWPAETVREVLLKLFVELLQVACRKKKSASMLVEWWYMQPASFQWLWSNMNISGHVWMTFSLQLQWFHTSGTPIPASNCLKPQQNQDKVLTWPGILSP